jgi:hypothetical protein
MSEWSTHIGGCNALCEGDGHYLVPDWATVAEHASAVAEANRHTAAARLATRAALVLMSDPEATS